MWRYFKLSSFKDLLLVIVTVIFIFEMFYYVRLYKRRARQETEVAQTLARMNISSADLWVTQHAHLTRESILKLRENACKIPVLNPFAPKIMEFFKPANKSCHRRKKKFYFKSHVQENNSQFVILMFREKPPEERCCYEQLRFAKTYSYAPINLKTDKCVFFTENSTVVPFDSEYIIIKCWNTTKYRLKLAARNISDSYLQKQRPSHYEILFYVPQPSPELLHSKKMRLLSDEKSNGETPLNVIILGFDQVSRANFIRLMRKTFEFLRTELDAIDLQGFNKMGDATLNNTLALLTGHDFASILSHPQYFQVGDEPFFDECPWIWKNFSEKGYITAYADDYVSVFNYRFKGFRRQPTDYYMEPFLQWYHNYDMARWEKFGSYNCIGNEIALDLLQDHAKKVAAAVKDHPYFHFMWFSKMHERPDFPALADASTLETLKYFQSNGVLNRSLVILLSDHGWRAGPIMLDSQARLENRLSYAFLILPQWFQNKYSLAYQNLRENQYRLTSPYDIHATLEDILNVPEKLSSEILEKRKSPVDSKGVSLFLAVSKGRTCASSGIDEEWCACTNYENFLNNSPIATQLANYAVSTLNSWVRPFFFCQKYVLHNVISAEVKMPYSQALSNSLPIINLQMSQQFRIVFGVLPEITGAQFEVTIFTDPDYWQTGGSEHISMSTEVFRLNNYNSASCMEFRIVFGIRRNNTTGAQFEVTIFTDPDYWQTGGSEHISMSTEVFRLNTYNSASCMKVYSLKKICTCTN